MIEYKIGDKFKVFGEPKGNFMEITKIDASKVCYKFFDTKESVEVEKINR